MVALLSECYRNDNITSTSDNNNNLNINKNDEQKKLEPIPTVDSSSNEYADIPKPLKSELLKKDDSKLDTQFEDLTDYVEYLEKMVVDYKKYIEERFNEVNDQKFKVVENFSMGGGGKSMNDLLVYIITCVFVLLLVDYIFKMGKNSY
jgi:hypothetical protein